jgi:hypothetical protein
MQNLEPENFADLGTAESQTRTRNSLVLVISIWLIRTTFWRSINSRIMIGHFRVVTSRSM